MYSANVQDVHVPEIVDTFERTSTPIRNKAVRESQKKLRPNFDESRYVESQNIFDILGDSIVRLLETPDNWNSYDSPAPSKVAVKNAFPILRALHAKLLQPERILPSAEGGVSFIFVSDTISRAVIESLNSGQSFVLMYDVNGNSKVYDWPATPDAQLNLVSRLEFHLRSNGIAPQG